MTGLNSQGSPGLAFLTWSTCLAENHCGGLVMSQGDNKTDTYLQYCVENNWYDLVIGRSTRYSGDVLQWCGR